MSLYQEKTPATPRSPRKLTRAEEFMAKFISPVCDDGCSTSEGMCEPCDRFLTKAGKELEAWLSKYSPSSEK